MSTAFAFLVVTLMLLAGRATRLLGCVCVFLMIVVAPLLSSALLIAAAVICYLIYGKRRFGAIPKKLPLPWRD